MSDRPTGLQRVEIMFPPYLVFESLGQLGGEFVDLAQIGGEIGILRSFVLLLHPSQFCLRLRNPVQIRLDAAE